MVGAEVGGDVIEGKPVGLFVGSVELAIEGNVLLNVEGEKEVKREGVKDGLVVGSCESEEVGPNVGVLEGKLE